MNGAARSAREQFVGPPRAADDRASAARIDAFDALTAYRVTKPRDLCEKLEIIAKDYGLSTW